MPLKTKVLVPVAVLVVLLMGAYACLYIASPSGADAAKPRGGITTDEPGALDVAGNPANNSPESIESAERTNCLEDSLAGMSIEQKAARSRELSEIARRKGISLYDLVGC